MLVPDQDWRAQVPLAAHLGPSCLAGRRGIGPDVANVRSLMDLGGQTYHGQVAQSETICGPSKVYALNGYVEGRCGNGITVRPANDLSPPLTVDTTPTLKPAKHREAWKLTLGIKFPEAHAGVNGHIFEGPPRGEHIRSPAPPRPGCPANFDDRKLLSA